ncbi:hypothetical protein D3C72_1276790 [compost metagenome]
MARLKASAMKRSPFAARAKALGRFSVAAEAGPLSPRDGTPEEALPVPATVEICPWASTLRTIWLDNSAMNMLPRPSAAKPTGAQSLASEAWLSFASYPEVPVPAKRETIAAGASSTVEAR